MNICSYYVPGIAERHAQSYADQTGRPVHLYEMAGMTTAYDELLEESRFTGRFVKTVTPTGQSPAATDDIGRELIEGTAAARAAGEEHGLSVNPRIAAADLR